MLPGVTAPVNNQNGIDGSNRFGNDGLMDLITYFTKQGGTATPACPVLAAVATTAGCGAGTLYMIARGHKTPSAKLAKRLQDATGGEVTCHELLPDVFGPAPAAKKARAA